MRLAPLLPLFLTTAAAASAAATPATGPVENKQVQQAFHELAQHCFAEVDCDKCSKLFSEKSLELKSTLFDALLPPLDKNATADQVSEYFDRLANDFAGTLKSSCERLQRLKAERVRKNQDGNAVLPARHLYATLAGEKEKQAVIVATLLTYLPRKDQLPTASLESSYPKFMPALEKAAHKELAAARRLAAMDSDSDSDDDDDDDSEESSDDEVIEPSDPIVESTEIPADSSDHSLETSTHPQQERSIYPFKKYVPKPWQGFVNAFADFGESTEVGTGPDETGTGPETEDKAEKDEMLKVLKEMETDMAKLLQKFMEAASGTSFSAGIGGGMFAGGNVASGPAANGPGPVASGPGPMEKDSDSSSVPDASTTNPSLSSLFEKIPFVGGIGIPLNTSMIPLHTFGTGMGAGLSGGIGASFGPMGPAHAGTVPKTAGPAATSAQQGDIMSFARQFIPQGIPFASGGFRRLSAVKKFKDMKKQREEEDLPTTSPEMGPFLPGVTAPGPVPAGPGPLPFVPESFPGMNGGGNGMPFGPGGFGIPFCGDESAPSHVLFNDAAEKMLNGLPFTGKPAAWKLCSTSPVGPGTQLTGPGATQFARPVGADEAAGKISLLGPYNVGKSFFVNADSGIMGAAQKYMSSGPAASGPGPMGMGPTGWTVGDWPMGPPPPFSHPQMKGPAGAPFMMMPPLPNMSSGPGPASAGPVTSPMARFAHMMKMGGMTAFDFDSFIPKNVIPQGIPGVPGSSGPVPVSSGPMYQEIVPEGLMRPVMPYKKFVMIPQGMSAGPVRRLGDMVDEEISEKKHKKEKKEKKEKKKHHHHSKKDDSNGPEISGKGPDGYLPPQVPQMSEFESMRQKYAGKYANNYTSQFPSFDFSKFTHPPVAAVPAEHEATIRQKLADVGSLAVGLLLTPYESAPTQSPLFVPVGHMGPAQTAPYQVQQIPYQVQQPMGTVSGFTFPLSGFEYNPSFAGSGFINSIKTELTEVGKGVVQSPSGSDFKRDILTLMIETDADGKIRKLEELPFVGEDLFSAEPQNAKGPALSGTVPETSGPSKAVEAFSLSASEAGKKELKNEVAAKFREMYDALVRQKLATVLDLIDNYWNSLASDVCTRTHEIVKGFGFSVGPALSGKGPDNGMPQFWHGAADDYCSFFDAPGAGKVDVGPLFFDTTSNSGMAIVNVKPAASTDSNPSLEQVQKAVDQVPRRLEGSLEELVHGVEPKVNELAHKADEKLQQMHDFQNRTGNLFHSWKEAWDRNFGKDAQPPTALATALLNETPAAVAAPAGKNFASSAPDQVRQILAYFKLSSDGARLSHIQAFEAEPVPMPANLITSLETRIQEGKPEFLWSGWSVAFYVALASFLLFEVAVGTKKFFTRKPVARNVNEVPTEYRCLVDPPAPVMVA